MKADSIRRLPLNATLRLKDERAAAYGMNTVHITLEWVKERPGYDTPWVAGRSVDGKLGYYKPSDFLCAA